MSKTQTLSLPVYQELGVPTVINGVGYATRVGGSWPSEAVIAAMADAQRGFIEIDDLQSAASECIARHTGAEAGLVTCGAGAALTLAAAACLVGSDTEAMEALPNTSHLVRNRIVYPQPHAFDYDHAVRLSGAQLDLVDYDAPEALARIEAAISDNTAALGYVWKRMGQSPSVAEVAALAHRHELPLVVDAALSLPPTEHLRRFIAEGADLVALSGGKHLGGPQASGLLFGRRDLVRSAWVQMVDMDVRASTWSLRKWMNEGWIARPPRHGIGRSMKVSKEAIVGVLNALNNYTGRDHEAELALWQKRIAAVQEGLCKLEALSVKSLFPAPNGQPFPCLRISLAGGIAPLIDELRAQRPKVVLAESEDDRSIAYLFPMQLRDEQIPLLVQAFLQALATLQKAEANQQ